MDPKEGNSESTQQRDGGDAVRRIQTLEENEGCDESCRGETDIIHWVDAIREDVSWAYNYVVERLTRWLRKYREPY